MWLCACQFVCLKRPSGGGGGGLTLTLTIEKHKSNLFYWQRKERTPPPLPFFLVLPPRHHPSSPTQQLFLSLSAPPLQAVPEYDGFVLLLCSVRQGNPPRLDCMQGSGCPWMLECSGVDAPTSRGLGGTAGHLVSKWALWPFKLFVLTHFERVLHMWNVIWELDSCVHICRWSKL